MERDLLLETVRLFMFALYFVTGWLEGEKKRLVRDGEVENQKIALECKYAWCTFTEVHDWWMENVFLVPYAFIFSTVAYYLMDIHS